MADDQFPGFPRKTLRFLEALAKNNERDWFEEHRTDYQKYFLEPARAFVKALGRRLVLIAPHLHADPRVNRSIFRIHRDTRFSKKKLPYKTHLGLWFWEGRGKRTECPGFYFQLEPEKLVLGGGMYQFSKGKLKSYREAMRDSRRAERLEAIVEGLEKSGYSIGGKHYKRMPRGFNSSHPQSRLLLHKGLYASHESKPGPAAHRPGFADQCFEHYHAMIDLHRWLMQLA